MESEPLEHCCGACAYGHALKTGQIEPPVVQGEIIGPQRELQLELGAGAPTVVVRHRTTVGRGSTCDVRIADLKLSRIQFLLERLPEGWRITDQQSACGTFVDGQLVQSALLREGSEILVGDSVLRVRGV